MAIENVQQLLTEQLGKNRCDVIATPAMTSKNYYAVYFPVTSVIASITVANSTGEAALVTTIPAGTTLFMNTTQIQLTSGLGIGYDEGASS